MGFLERLRHQRLDAGAVGFGGAAGGVVEGALVLQPLLRQALVQPLGLGLFDLADEVIDGELGGSGLFGRHGELVPG